MSAISETIDRVLGRNGHERIPHPYWDTHGSVPTTPIFSELVSIINAQETISDSELADLHTLLLDDYICAQIFEDSHPESKTNTEDMHKDIGMMDITAIFHRFRPSEASIVAKKDSLEPSARMFSIWMCTYNGGELDFGLRIGAEDCDYSPLSELLFDEWAGVGNVALQMLGSVLSHQVLYQEIKDYLGPSNTSRDSPTLEWLFRWLDDINKIVDGFEPDDNPHGYSFEEYADYALQDSDMCMWGGSTWARVVIALKEDKDLMEYLHQQFENKSISSDGYFPRYFPCRTSIDAKYRPEASTSGSCENKVWYAPFVDSMSCAKCDWSSYCDECLNDERICKTCANEE